LHLLPWEHCSKICPSLHVGTIAHPQQIFSLTNNIVKKPNACSACNAPCQRKNNHIAFAHNNQNLSLQSFNVTIEQKD
jgi:hypothetical protein